MGTNSRIVGALVHMCMTHALMGSAAAWNLESPNGKVRVAVQLGAPAGSAAYPKDKPRLYYRVEHGAAGERVAVIPDSPLGLTLKDLDFVDGLRFEAAEGPRRIDEQYTMPHGKRRECRNAANALLLRFRNASGAQLELELRAYDDGAAFRYGLPGGEAKEAGPAGNATRHTLLAEETGFAMHADARLWMHPADKATTYSPAYETNYENGVRVGTPSPTGMGWSFPLLFCTADQKHWGLITESDVGRDDYGGRLTGDAPGGVYRIRMPHPDEGNGYGAVQPSFALPWKSPWRVVILGDSPGAIVESTLVNDVGTPSAVAKQAWIKPGRVAWSWWSDQDSPRDGGKQKRFIDFAAEMGWEYVLVDANWTIIDNGTIHDVIRHAKAKGVGVLLWYNSGGPNNIVTEKPRDCLFYPKVRRFELDLLKKWGVKGVKVDFFHSDKPEIMALYLDILKDAADAKIMVNFHGCTLPRGWSRTYPHLMSMEAVRGEECYLFDDRFPDMAPVQNTILPFTRNAVGPMDYTPVGLGNARHHHKTTYAHELALAVLFESGWIHFADDPDVYRKLPDIPKQFLKDVPAAWDDTRFVAGFPGRDVVLARRHGNEWYVAGVNGRNEAQQQALDLRRVLPAGKYQMTLIADGPDGRQLAGETRPAAAEEPLKVSLLPYGGFVARFRPE